jgi:hypothetical protein
MTLAHPAIAHPSRIQHGCIGRPEQLSDELGKLAARAKEAEDRVTAAREKTKAEEVDTDTGRHLGNFPRAFSHLALIEAAARIIVAELVQEFRLAGSFSGSSGGGRGLRTRTRARPNGP